MDKAIVIYNGSQVYTLDPSQTAEQAAAGFNITDPALYAEFDSSDFDEACYSFTNAFTLIKGVVGFDLDKAKEIANAVVSKQSNQSAKKTLEGLSYDLYIAQCALPVSDRIAKYQAAIDANNTIAVETEQRQQAIVSATTIQEVNAIVYPS
jgi:hypothetical protein